MRLYAILPAVIVLLQRERRVTYQALRHDFGFDEAFLDLVRRELIFKQLAVDEHGEGLIWTGIASTSLPLVVTAPVPPTDTPPAVPLAEVVAVPPGAERRQLTVMFCDLADSTVLAQQLDPEDLREVIRAYQATAAAVIDQFEGYIAQYLGDGLLVYFGWPVAHEDDAPRALHSGLGIVEAITTQLNPRLQREKGVELAVRVGIHTGPVVVGEMGGGGRHEHLATGDTVNIAARLEGLAAPNTVLISRFTEQLVRNVFVLDDLGPHELKGVAEPMRVFRVVGVREPGDEAEDARHGDFTALVGRDEEIGLLLRRWEQSKQGQGQVVLLSGDAGIGKSSLVEGLRQHVRQEGYTRIALSCSEYTQQSALYPVIQHLHRVLGWQRDDPAEMKLARLEQALQQTRLPLEESVPLLAGLLSLSLPDGRYPPLLLPPQQQRQQTQDVLVAWMLEEAERYPVLVVWEDLHWADPSTVDLLALFIDQIPTVAMLHVLVYRQTFMPSWPTQSHMTPLTLHRLERLQVEAMITRLARGKALPLEVVAHIVAKTDGVPLYVEELTKMLLESAFLREEDEQYTLRGPLAEAAIPATLQDSLMARLDRLPTVREVAQLGAVLGREFAYEMLQALTAVAEPTLQAGLRQLVDSELLYQRGRPPRATYTFRHALVRDTAYQSLLRRTRQQYHQQVAQLLETQFPEVVETQPELVAHHYTEAGLTESAMTYWQKAGQRASDRSANQEAIKHFTTGLQLLQTLAESPERVRQELALQIPLGVALLMTKGHGAPEVEAAYSRARALCQQLGDTPELFPVLFGLWRFYIVVPDFTTTYAIGEELLQLARSDHNPGHLVVAHYALGFSCFCRGELVAARDHFTAGASRYAPEQRRLAVFRAGQDPGVACRGYGAWTLWLLGYPKQALAWAHETVGLARELEHPFTLGYALSFGATMVLQFCDDVQGVQEQAEEAIVLSTEQGFTLWHSLGTFLEAWARTAQGQPGDVLGHMQEVANNLRAAGTVLLQPYFLALIAEECGKEGRAHEGLQQLDEALVLMEKTGERWWEAELYRLKGELLCRAGDGMQNAAAIPAVAVEECFQQALAIARRQSAKSLELRAAMSLSRLWQNQGKTEEARQLLAEMYDWFTEGCDTKDLQEAKGVLEALQH